MRDLSHPQFNVRSEAAASLGEAPEDALPVLVQAYQGMGEYEPKLRLRSAIERVFYRKQLQGRMGFLGVQPRVEGQIFDPVLGKTVEVIFMTRVLPDFPAESAGIRTGDMLLALDGKPAGELMGPAIAQKPIRQQFNGGLRFVMPGSPQIDAFTNEISRREPGTTVKVRLLRADAVDRELKLTLSDDPGRTLEGAGLLLANVPLLRNQFNEMLGPSMRQGICVTAVEKNSPAARAGLKAGDVIVGLGRSPLPPGVAPDQLKDLMAHSKPGSQLALTLSHVEQVNVSVTLGGRPVDRMNPGDMEIAQARFAEWWRQQTGESSLRSSNRPEVYTPKLGTALPEPSMLP